MLMRWTVRPTRLARALLGGLLVAVMGACTVDEGADSGSTAVAEGVWEDLDWRLVVTAVEGDPRPCIVLEGIGEPSCTPIEGTDAPRILAMGGGPDEGESPAYRYAVAVAPEHFVSAEVHTPGAGGRPLRVDNVPGTDFNAAVYIARAEAAKDARIILQASGESFEMPAFPY